MYFPALTAVRWDDNFKEMYAKLVSKQGIKMKALVAVQRKLLEMIYTIYKNKTPYDKNYEIKKSNKKNSVQTQMA
ncbi:hypothetical protein [Flavobacterium sp.]|uniref:hypothetical protein n=1 Tax=Flavobacterium sp. TaxID=239 RepID=UPI00374FE58B